MLESTIRNILFDLDGTLIEPEEGILNSIMYSLKKLGIDDDRETLKGFIGPPLIDSYRKRYGFNENEGKNAVDLYREYFSEKGLYENSLYPGIKEVLESFRRKRVNIFLATSKPTVFAEKILEHYKIDHLFTGIVGSNLDHTRNEKTEIIAYIIHKFRISAKESLMIGDRNFDIIGAKNNGVLSASVTYGYGSSEEIERAEPDFILNKTEDILTLFKG